MDSHATFLSDTALCTCAGSAFTMNLKWSQQTVRGSWLGWKSQLTYSGDKAPDLRSWFLHWHQQWWKIFKLYQTSASWGNFSHGPMCFQRWKKQFVWRYVLSTFVKDWLWWGELYKFPVWIVAVHDPAVGCRNCWWLTWQKAANAIQSKYISCTVQMEFALPKYFWSKFVSLTGIWELGSLLN